MIGNFDRVEVEFFKFDMEKLEPITVTHIAKSQEELIEIQNLFYNEYQDQEYKMIKNKIVKCSCGQEVNCPNFTNTCSCGSDYNFNGSLLASRSQWGIETGEHWSECY